MCIVHVLGSLQQGMLSGTSGPEVLNTSKLMYSACLEEKKYNNEHLRNFYNPGNNELSKACG